MDVLLLLLIALGILGVAYGYWKLGPYAIGVQYWPSQAHRDLYELARINANLRRIRATGTSLPDHIYDLVVSIDPDAASLPIQILSDWLRDRGYEAEADKLRQIWLDPKSTIEPPIVNY